MLVADDENELFKNSPQSQPSNSNQLPDDFNGHENNFDDDREAADEEEEEDERGAYVDEEIEETTTCDSFFSGEYTLTLLHHRLII